jgi:phospholipase A-2-activating protein
MDYSYSGACVGHRDYVRSVVALPNNYFASGSRDGTIKIWMLEAIDGVPNYTCLNTLNGHHKVVGGIASLQYIPAGVFDDSHPDLKDGVLVSGAYDKRILLWGRNAWLGIDSSPSLELASHTKEVVSLAITHEGDIVSGSADCTVKLWKPRTKVYSPVKDFYGHKAPVWGVTVLDNGDIASGSGDRTIKIWDATTGEMKHDVQDHEDCVRGLANLSGIGIICCSNDFSVRLYTYDGLLIHLFVGHENFVFSAKVLQDGYFGTAGDDGCVKIWKDFQCVQSLQHPIGLWDLAQLENGDIIAACQDNLVRVWSADPARKAPIEVLEDFNNLIVANMQKAAESKKKPPKQELDGEYFDFAFPIEFDDGTPPLKLGYNLGDNAYTVAEEFVAKYKLNYGLKETIAKHILSQTKGYQLDEEQPNDPMKKAQNKSVSVSQFFPLTKNIIYDKNINMQGVLTKITEFNAILEKSEDKKELALLPYELELLKKVITKLGQNHHSISFDTDEYVLAFRLLAWPGEYLFAVLDLIRCWVLVLEVARFFVKPASFKVTKMETGLTSNVNLPAGVTGVLIQDVIVKGIRQQGHQANKKLSFWILVNLFTSVDEKILNYEEDLLTIIKEFHKTGDASIADTITGIAVNLSILYYANIDGTYNVSDFLVFILEWLSTTNDETQQLRLIIAVANIVCNSNRYLTQAKSTLLPILQKASQSSNNKIKLVALDLLKLVK